jgi:hypothetical protein
VAVGVAEGSGVGVGQCSIVPGSPATCVASCAFCVCSAAIVADSTLGVGVCVSRDGTLRQPANKLTNNAKNPQRFMLCLHHLESSSL